MAATGKSGRNSLLFIANFAIVLGYVSCSEQFIITHAPNHVKFLPDGGQISISEIPAVIASTYGFSPNQDISWEGLAEGNLFKRPKASVMVSIDGFSDNLNLDHVAQYPAKADDNFLDTEMVVNNIQRSPYQSRPLIVDFTLDSTVFDVKSEHPGLFHDLSPTLDKVKQVLQYGKSPVVALGVGTLNVSQEVDLLLLGELQLIAEILEALKQQPGLVNDATPDFFHFRVRGLQRLLETYGSKSPQAQDAVQLLQAFLQKVTSDMRELYGGNVVVQVVTLPKVESPHVRKARSLLQEAPTTQAPSPEKKLNLAPAYDDDYPVIFNIILWLMVGLIVSIIAVAYGMWNMDPGRDSIIYRMTTQRIKKD